MLKIYKHEFFSFMLLDLEYIIPIIIYIKVKQNIYFKNFSLLKYLLILLIKLIIKKK